MDSKLTRIAYGVLILVLLAAIVYVPSLLRALTISGVFDGEERNVIYERMYVFNSSVLHIWFGIGTTKYLPYDFNDASTVFPIVTRIVREGWMVSDGIGALIYANWDPENFNRWEISVKWSHRNMGYSDRQNIVPHGWILSTEDIDTPSYEVTWSVYVGYRWVNAGFSVSPQPADVKDTYVPQYGDLNNGWLDLGWGMTNRFNSVWPLDLSEYKTTGIFLVSWKNNYMQYHDGESLHIRILSKVKYAIWKLNINSFSPVVPYGAWILVWPATLGDGSYDNDAITEVVPGYRT